jgi:hypothetical protein
LTDNHEARERLQRKTSELARRKAGAAQDARAQSEAAARKAAAAERERLLNPAPEIEQMRAVGRAFVEAMRNIRRLPSLHPKTWSSRCRVGYKEKQRGWRIDVYAVPGSQSGRFVTVLDDGRVGHEAWMKPGGTPPYQSQWLPWHDLPWSEQLEDVLAEWLVDHAVVS